MRKSLILLYLLSLGFLFTACTPSTKVEDPTKIEDPTKTEESTKAKNSIKAEDPTKAKNSIKAQEFKSQTGQFSIASPLAFEEETKTLDTMAGKIDLHMFTASEKNKAYFVAYADYPEQLLKMSNPEKMLDGARDGAVSNATGTLVSETKVSIDGAPGRELTIAARGNNGQEGIVKARIYLVKNRLYQAMVVAPKGEVSTPEMDAFLQSFKLAQK